MAARAELFANANGQVSNCAAHHGRVWLVTLQPGERLPFHRHVLDYFWTVTSPGGGHGRWHFGDGRVAEVEYVEGETQHLFFGPGESMILVQRHDH